MASRRRLVLAPSAYQDLKGIHDHIAADNPQVARKQVKRILIHAEMLRDYPEIGFDRSRLAASLRSVIEKPYVVFYYPRDDRIEIVRVFHGHQDIEAELVSFLEKSFKPGFES